jgi:hypothetical protein
MAQTQTIIAGHSHTVCLGVQYESDDSSPKLLDLTNGDSRFQGLAVFLHPSYWDRLAQLAAGRKVALFWSGNQHLAYYLFASPPLFDFFLSRRPDMPVEANTHIVPETAVRARFAPTFEGLHYVMDRLQTARLDCQPILCGTPPPKGNDGRLRALLANEPYFVSLALAMKAGLQDVELSPRLLRLKLWLVLQEMLEDVARAHSVPFLPVSASVQTGDGFLAEEYWGGDATHANEAYGRVMRDHLAAALNLPPNSAD